MSLQKIQVELSVIKKIADPIADGEFDLASKIWQDFKDWRNQPKYVRRETTARKESLALKNPPNSKAQQPDEHAE